MNKYLQRSLAMSEAEARSQLFDLSKDLVYYLFLKIKTGETYEGKVIIHFQLKKVSPDLFLDYAGTTINQITINSTQIETDNGYEHLRDLRSLRIPDSNLREGQNEIIISFSNTYTNDGMGLHSFVDTDGKQYIYSLCCPYAANKIFPCFDQPDIKARFALTIAHPNEWVAISNEPISHQKTSELDARQYLTAEELQAFKVVVFEETPKLSTYLYTAIVGPFLEIKSQKTHRNIQMSCYSRESLFPYLKEQAAEFFELTAESLRFYEGFFDLPYPFTKYDMIFCPEFKYGGMENPGAVVFNDGYYIFRENVTNEKRTSRAITFTHEASHHWFGNLVTMKWWNDLWLNESFAVYISFLCGERIRERLTTLKLNDVWLRLFHLKCGGYDADEKSTTHPIAGHVLNTEQADTIFDAITYRKGGAVLKQLVCLIGVENFGKAVSSYFKRYAWGNATLDDFTSCLQEYYTHSIPGCPKDLMEWKKEWIQKAGLNECTTVFNPEDNSDKAMLTIRQWAVLEAFPTLRHHKLKIAFFNEDAEVIDVKDVVLGNTEYTSIEYDGSKKPRAVLVNYGDEAFIKVTLDEHSLGFFKRKLSSVKEQLTRGLIWRSIFDMVKDGKLSGYNFVQIAEEAIEKEKSDSLLENLFLFMSTHLFELCPGVLNDNVIKPALFSKTLKRLLATDKQDSNAIILFRDNLIQFASFGKELNVDNITRLIDWIDEKDPELKQIQLTLGNKWSIVKILHQQPNVSNEIKAEYFNKVAELDKSDRKNLIAKYCEAARSSTEERQKLWQSLIDPTYKSSVQVYQQELLGYSHSVRDGEEHARLFFENVEKVFQSFSGEFAPNFYNVLFPKQEKLDYYSQRVRELLGKVKEQSKLWKMLQNSLYDLERKKRAYECSIPDVMKKLLDISV